jgi:hypothetical protein
VIRFGGTGRVGMAVAVTAASTYRTRRDAVKKSTKSQKRSKKAGIKDLEPKLDPKAGATTAMFSGGVLTAVGDVNGASARPTETLSLNLDKARR